MIDAPLPTLETYYDTAPRASADAEEVGPFTLFVRREPDGWPFYARPRLGLSGDVTTDDVAVVLARQAELGLPASLEWVHQTTPSLLDAARAADLRVEECPLLVLAEHSPSHARATGAAPAARTRALAPDDPDLPLVVGAVHAGFSSSDDVEPRDASRQQRLMERGLLELSAQDDAVARVYERVGFVRVGTACIAGEESS